MMEDTLKKAITSEDQITAMRYYMHYIDSLWCKYESDDVSISYARNATAYAFCLMMERFNAMGWQPETEFFKMMLGSEPMDENAL